MARRTFRRARGGPLVVTLYAQEVELLVKIGEYKEGSDRLADEALAKIDAIRAFLRQRTDDKSDFDETVQMMQQLV